jgi:GT2 family glycosyltransferase
MAAKGDVIVFLDSDMVVVDGFIEAHMKAQDSLDVVAHGPFIQTSNFDDPRSEKRRWTDFSRAFFATGNSSVRKEWLVKAGLFDEDFSEYGWEDLELGIRLRKLNLRAVQAKDAIGFHYKPESHEYNLDESIAREESRARMAAVFLRKHPTFEVRMMVLDLWLFYALEGLLTLGGWPDWPAARNLIKKLSRKGRTPLVLFLAKFVTGHAYAKVLKKEIGKLRSRSLLR